MTTLAECAIGEKLKRARLPAIPQVLAKLLALCRQDTAGIPELAALLRQDPALTVKILNVASGEMYRRGNAVLNLEQSLIAIGTNMVKTILISEAVYQAFEPLTQNAGLDLRPFWAHSLSAALAAQEAATLMAYPRPEEAYLAGLLHDVGRLALLSAAPSEYGDYFHLNDEQTLIADERENFHIDHAEIGAWVAEQWRVDSYIADSIRYHHEHETRLVSTHPLLRIVALSHCMTARPRAGQRMLASAALCGLKAEHLERIDKRVRDNMDKLARHVGIDPASIEGASPRLPPVLAEPDPARLAITAQMQDMALASELSRCFTGMETAMPVPLAVARAACVLFGFSSAVVLGIDKNERILKPAARDESALRLSEFAMPIAGGGRIMEALLRRQITCIAGADTERNIFEEQLVRIFGAANLVAAPIADGDLYYGVLVGAADDALLSMVERRHEMLRLFGEQANKVLRDTAQPRSASPAPDGDEARAEQLVAQYQQRAREIAHEVNNPLSIIRNYLAVLDRKIAKNEPVSAEISILQEEIDRASSLIDGLNDAGDAARKEYAPLAAVLGDAARLLRESEMVPASVQLNVGDIDPALQLACDARTVKQIFLNLIRNAAEALAAQDRMQDQDQRRIDIVNEGFTSWESKLCISLSVIDNGPGIAHEVMSRLFSPVTSTKGDDHKGLGLSIVHGLVKKAQGMISCRSSSAGTVFQLLLPLSAHSGNPEPAGSQQMRT